MPAAKVLTRRNSSRAPSAKTSIRALAVAEKLNPEGGGGVQPPHNANRTCSGFIECRISDVLAAAPEAQSLLAPRFSVGKRYFTIPLRSPVGTVQGHFFCSPWRNARRTDLITNSSRQKKGPWRTKA